MVTDFVEAFRFNGPYAEGVNLDKVMQALHEVMNNLQPLVDKVKEAWAGFTKALHEAWQMIEPTLLPAIQQIKDAFNNDLMPALTKLGGIINANVIPAIKVLGTIIGGAVLIIIALILKLLPIIIRVGAAIVTTVIDVIAPVIAALVGILSGAFRIIGGLIQVFIGLFTGDWSKMWEGIKNIFGGAWDAIVALFQGAWNTIFAIVAGAIRIVVAFFVGLYNTLVGHSIIPDMINAIIGWFLRLPGAIGGAIAKVVSAIIAWAGNIAARGARAAQGFLDSVMARFNNLKGLIGTAISNAVSSITGFAQQAWDNAKKLGSSIWEGFKKGMGISSPSFIERAMVQVGKVTNDQVANLAEQVRYMQRLGSTIPDFSSNFVPATIPATQMAPVRQAALADQQTMAQANSIAAQLKAIGVNQQRPIAMHIGTVEDGDSLFRRARAADKMLSMAEGGDSQQIGGLGI